MSESKLLGASSAARPGIVVHFGKTGLASLPKAVQGRRRLEALVYDKGMTVKELEQAVSQLSPDEFERFSAWFERFCATSSGSWNPQRLKREVRRGLEALDRGDFTECDDSALDEFFREIGRKARQRRKSAPNQS